MFRDGKHFSEEVTRRNLSCDNQEKNFSVRKARTRFLRMSLSIHRTRDSIEAVVEGIEGKSIIREG